jgi:hypothetical protein
MVVKDAAKARPARNGSDPSPAGASARHASEEMVCLELTEAQVEGVIRATADARGPSLSLLLSGLISEQAITEGSLEDRYFAELESGRLSHSLFRGLLILALFISGEEGRGVVEVARQLGLSPSTTHRYMTTLSDCSCRTPRRASTGCRCERALGPGTNLRHATPRRPLGQPALRRRRRITARMGTLDGPRQASVRLAAGRACSVRAPGAER